ncbi:hypothetical protein GCM10009547_21570 [Sporichthya brevicatena]|uniref:Uncharacterized protein n=1 Tax=Sporichthya brevicatena TaxID=171442 RepID=A0ABN1GTA7_9ACTN
MDVSWLRSQWDRVLAIGLTVAGAVCLLAGYAGVADSKLLAEQTRYITSGGLGGLFLLALGVTLWVSADLRDEWRKLDRIERMLAGGVLRWAEPSAAAETEPEVPDVPEVSEITEISEVSEIPEVRDRTPVAFRELA